MSRDRQGGHEVEQRVDCSGSQPAKAPLKLPIHLKPAADGDKENISISQRDLGYVGEKKMFAFCDLQVVTKLFLFKDQKPFLVIGPLWGGDRLKEGEPDLLCSWRRMCLTA